MTPPKTRDLESVRVLKSLSEAHRFLAELKGIVHSIPNEKILLSTLILQEAKESSAIENIITTQDSMYKHQIQSHLQNPANKEIYNYAKAMEEGCKKITADKGLSLNTILKVQSFIEPARPGFRKVPGTVLKNTVTNKTIYTPPSPEKIPELMNQLEHFINTNSVDPLIKMAVIHHWFESIHPFYDGNGRTGRIINILYLILKNLLDSPVLYLSRYINRNKSDYYNLLQQVREQEDWEKWIMYMLQAVSVIARETTQLIKKIDKLFREYKIIVREKHRFYSHDLINTIFSYPYTKIKFLETNMKVSRATATRYLDALAKDGILEKRRLGKESYYVNIKLFKLLADS